MRAISEKRGLGPRDCGVPGRNGIVTQKVEPRTKRGQSDPIRRMFISSANHPAGVRSAHGRSDATGGTARLAGAAAAVRSLMCAVLFVAAGCAGGPATGTGAAPSSPASHLVVVNESPSAWQVSVLTGERVLGSWRLQPAAVVEAEVPAGRITIQQALLGADSSLGESRSFPMVLSPGETYRWRLVSLMTRPEETALPVQPSSTP